MTSNTSATAPNRHDWMSQRAIAWVIHDAPVPAELAWTLVVIAHRCDEHGKGSWQNTKTIAALAGKSVKQVQREIVRLRELGLIVLGDQSQVAHLPAGQRPTVYDVPLHVKGPKPLKESRNKSGLRKDGGQVDTPPLDGTPPLQGTSPLEGVATPPLEGDPTPPLEGRQNNPMNNPLNNPSSLSARTSLPGPRDPADDRERDDTTTSENPNHDQRHRWVIEAGCPHHLAAEVVDYLEAKHDVRHMGWWKTVRKDGDLPKLVSEAVFVNTPTAVTDDDTACHTCGDTGRIETRSMYEGDALKANPCHHCTNDGRGNCRIHPGYRSRRCAGCRGDRIAVQDHQGRRSEPENANARNARGWLDLPTPPEQPAIEASPTL